jgi:predicted house-cleaning noncanonical NTP pyrophosphatase (MazG superfamily)
MLDNEIISNFLTELGDKVQSEINEFFELDHEEQLQLAYAAIDRIVEHINDILEKIDSEDGKELLEFLIRQNNEFLAIKFSHILPLSLVIALYFAKGNILKEIMQYYVESIESLA